MYLRTVSPVTLPGAGGERLFAIPLLMSSRSCYSISENSGSRFCPSSLKEFGRKRSGNGGDLVVPALAEKNNNSTRTGLVFQPFEEVKSDSFVVPSSGNVSLARHKYADECEAAINEQINCRQSCEGSDGSHGKASSESKQGRTCS